MDKENWPIINNKYIVHKKIATGTQGSVVLATDKDSRSRYAIKIYKQKQQKDYFTKYVKLEMEKLKQSKSQYIIRLEDILVDANYMKPDNSVTTINAIVMEYASYGNFHDLIYLTGPFNEKVAKYYFKQLILGINYLHNEQNICHRDLKPDNMLLNENLEMKICDLAMSATLSNQLTTTVGNLQFQAPELHKLNQVEEINNQQQEQQVVGYNGRATDIFSAGVILYLMLTGTYPFFSTKCYNDTTIDKIWQSYRIKAQAASNCSNSEDQKKSSFIPLSQEVIDLINQMLQKEPLNRISLAEIISHPWLQQEVDKKEITQFMQEKINTYLKETRTEYRQKKSELEKQGSTGNLYNGVQKFRSDSSGIYEKQVLAQEMVETLQLDKKTRQFKIYSDSDIWIHDYEFEAKPEQGCIEEIKKIMNYLYCENTISNVILDDNFYKISFQVQGSEQNMAEVKISIKTKQNHKDVYLIALSKNQGMKSLGLNIYQKIKQILQ
ncbi:Serine/Threonine kinase domain protein (macronuclear) [Tetrahymena thermophila SB210]|uniref:Serine/Threonine kinase domain protein n=1 Tax=Tetrahymena thermophila (strain SB210) TaxID=312017 RepID=Q23GD5_TETTS|nr:Serine/Threonine kinase domain protein [Tetrahymena thermophila SB210]EAR95325.3 Serine/Threonine kinase domain protein [Tetrahymena thermophila SB210]|eukprot:XP_001015570.3 Serine/Threonine kinase domain protein [Tetrahymena thermophila SB210]